MRSVVLLAGWRRWLVLVLLSVPIVLACVLRERAWWQTRTLRTGLEVAYRVSFSGDGSRLALLGLVRGGGPSALQLWDVDLARPIASALLPHDGFVEPVLFPDGRLMACLDSGAETATWIWDARDGHLVRTLRGVGEIAFVPEGGSFYALNGPFNASWRSREPDVRLLDARTLQVLEAHDIEAPREMSFFDTSDVESRNLHCSLAPRAHSLTLELWSKVPPDSGARGEPRGFLLVDLRSGKRSVLPQPHEAAPAVVLFSPDDDLVAMVTIVLRGKTPQYNTVAQVWHRASGRLKWQWQVEGEWSALAFTPDKSRLLMQGTADYSKFRNLTVLRDARTGRTLTSLRARNLRQPVLVPPDGALIASAGVEDTVPGSGYVMTDSRALLWDARTGQVARRLIGHRALVTDVAWSPDGSTLATASLDGTVKLWRVR